MVDYNIYDTDSDYLPDLWEMKYFDNLNYGANDDPDNDGYLNIQEKVNGTDPTQTDPIRNTTFFESYKDYLGNWVSTFLPS